MPKTARQHLARSQGLLSACRQSDSHLTLRLPGRLGKNSNKQCGIGFNQCEGAINLAFIMPLSRDSAPGGGGAPWCFLSDKLVPWMHVTMLDHGLTMGYTAAVGQWHLKRTVALGSNLEPTLSQLSPPIQGFLNPGSGDRKPETTPTVQVPFQRKTEHANNLPLAK